MKGVLLLMLLLPPPPGFAVAGFKPEGCGSNGSTLLLGPGINEKSATNASLAFCSFSKDCLLENCSFVCQGSCKSGVLSSALLIDLRPRQRTGQRDKSDCGEK